MLIISATKTEAAPLIQALGLSFYQKSPFSIYMNKEYRLIISGIGKVKAAAALQQALTLFEPSHIFNIGYAAGKAQGLYEITKVIDSESNKVFHLKPKSDLPKMGCTTLSLGATKELSTLADMEASALVEIANLNKTPISLYKVVSDRFDPKAFAYDSALMERFLDKILSLL